MTLEVSTTNARTVKALALFARCHEWTKGHLKDGRPFFAIPGSAGHIWWADNRSCTCPDFASRGGPCKHVTAVKLWQIAQPAPTRGPRQTSPSGLDDRITLTAEGAAALLELPPIPPIPDEEIDQYAADRGEDTGLCSDVALDGMLAGIKADHAWAREQSRRYAEIFADA